MNGYLTSTDVGYKWEFTMNHPDCKVVGEGDQIVILNYRVQNAPESQGTTNIPAKIGSIKRSKKEITGLPFELLPTRDETELLPASDETELDLTKPVRTNTALFSDVEGKVEQLGADHIVLKTLDDGKTYNLADIAIRVPVGTVKLIQWIDRACNTSTFDADTKEDDIDAQQLFEKMQSHDATKSWEYNYMKAKVESMHKCYVVRHRML